MLPLVQMGNREGGNWGELAEMQRRQHPSCNCTEAMVAGVEKHLLRGTGRGPCQSDSGNWEQKDGCKEMSGSLANGWEEACPGQDGTWFSVDGRH